MLRTSNIFKLTRFFSMPDLLKLSTSDLETVNHWYATRHDNDDEEEDDDDDDDDEEDEDY